MSSTSFWPKSLSLHFSFLSPKGPRYPVQLIESFLCFLIVFVSLKNFKVITDKKEAGFLGVSCILSYAIIRFFDEFLRADERGWLIKNVISPSQAVSLFLIVLCLFYFKKRPLKKEDF